MRHAHPARIAATPAARYRALPMAMLAAALLSGSTAQALGLGVPHGPVGPARMQLTVERAPGEGGGDAGNVNGSALLVGAGTTTLSPDFTSGSQAMDTAKDVAKGVVLSGALTAGLTLAIDRAQPHNGMDAFRAQTSAAFAVAPILASRYGWKAGMPAYTLAFMSGFGGANDGKYSTSGALASAAVGLAVGGVVAHHRRTALMPEHVYMGKRGLGLKVGF